MAEQTITLQEFLTPREIERVAELYKTAGAGQFARMVREEIIDPNWERIDKRLRENGKEAIPQFLAYVCECACIKASGG